MKIYTCPKCGKKWVTKNEPDWNYVNDSLEAIAECPKCETVKINYGDAYKYDKYTVTTGTISFPSGGLWSTGLRF